MPKGVYVYKILEDGAAAGSELREKDIITKLDGMTVKSMQDLQKFLKGYEAGETIELLVQRQEEESIGTADSGDLSGAAGGCGRWQ